MLVADTGTDRGKKRTVQKDGGRRFRIVMITAVVLVACLYSVWNYLNDYYEATEIAVEAMKGNDAVAVEETEDFYSFLPEAEERNGEGIIFYPGGRVEESAYGPLMLKLAECGYEVYLMRMPARLAVFKPSAADAVIEEKGQDRRWILMGHSLGGAMAANYAASHSEKVSTLVLLAAYGTKDLADSGISVISLYGSEDGVMNRDKYEKNRGRLPEDTAEYVIDGGNHGGFGYYGEQKGDKPATISRDEQQETVVDVLFALRGLQ